jgi:hypothetical protein
VHDHGASRLRLGELGRGASATVEPLGHSENLQEARRDRIRNRVRGARRVENATSRVALPCREPSATEVAFVYRLPTIGFP